MIIAPKSLNSTLFLNCMMRFKKRGVSPLIATVLLLAFAVALAVVIIQFPLTNPKLDVVLAGERPICYDNNSESIELFLKNQEKRKNVIGLLFVVCGSEDCLNKHVPIGLEVNEQKKIEFGYNIRVYGNISTIKIYSKINESGSIK